ncbi:MAG: glycoside hydrolase family 13 [Ignavibacteria bacterium CG22_combo_CG10-13_8_21_14_all_37_15]|nr:MAG: glycoside hydrolase family 13 [Ignavibacteria bacterium CG22_combo_CG10-13_8_21_14_all_37_15]
MAIIKKYSKDRRICHVTFILPKEISENFQQVSLVGEFNNWDIHKDIFSHNSPDGSCSAEYVLDAGKEYQFRYLGNGETWLNEPEADAETITHFGDSKNSILAI